MAKYNKKIVNKIATLISEDSYTISEICEKVNIHKSTYYDWINSKPDFSDAIKKAEEEFNDTIIVEAKKSLMKLVKGYTAQEKKTTTQDTGKKDENDKPIVKVKEHTVTEKHYQPNTAAVIFALTNRDPDNWKNRYNSDVSAEVSIKSDLDKLSDKELEQIIDGED